MHDVTERGGSAPHAEQEPSSRLGWATVGVLFIFYIFAMVDRQIMTMLVDPVRRDLGISDVQASLLLGFSFALFYTTFGLIMGWLVDRHSRRLIVGVSVALWGLASAYCGMAETYTELFIARTLVGVGEASLGPAAFSMLADSFPRRRLALALSVYTTGALVGGAIAIGISGMVVAYSATHSVLTVPFLGEIQSWRLVFLMTGLPGPLIALLAFAVPEPIRRTGVAKTVEKPQGLTAFLAQDPRLWICFCLGYGALNMILSSVFAWSPTYLKRTLELPPVSIGIMIGGLLLLAALPGQVFAGWFADRQAMRGKRDIYFRYHLIAVPMVVPFGIFALLQPDPRLFFLLMVPLYFVCMAFMGVATTALQLVTPNVYRGRVSAMFVMVTTLIGLGVGPTLVAWISTGIDPAGKALGQAMAIVVTGAASVAIIFLGAGLAPFRRAIGRFDPIDQVAESLD